MNRWKLYSTLKTERNTKEILDSIDKMEANEVKEGVIEYLLMRNRQKEVEDWHRNMNIGQKKKKSS